MRLPFISRRAFDDLGRAHSLLRGRLVNEQTAHREAEAELALLQKWITREMVTRNKVSTSSDRRLARAVRALAAERAQAAAYRRTIRRLTDQLLDATDYQGEPLQAAERRVLGIEDAKEES
ncbi:hypothetical protein [Streptomyces filamentosus]|uniref:hypothetical protein n=1 Tax=Streptomyces filamentosus TaxID=67294 RepID=UPI00123B9EE2|nr:hypothetical protein [Streptomyces filamentosus]KAA6211755.1 hypothetical protein CP979_35880 [Streptomyces filamentosus]KAA6220037.1 hypothetical protein CP979_26435 [Streptomyces filamentosus]